MAALGQHGRAGDGVVVPHGDAGAALRQLLVDEHGARHNQADAALGALFIVAHALFGVRAVEAGGVCTHRGQGDAVAELHTVDLDRLPELCIIIRIRHSGSS